MTSPAPWSPRRAAGALHDADAEPGQVERIGRHQARVLGGLATDQRAAGQLASVATPPTSSATRTGSTRPTAR